MKKLMILVFVLTGFCAMAQKDSVGVRSDSSKFQKKTRNNVISINASSFLEKTFKSGGSPDLTNSFLYYTRNFDKFFLRLGVNGMNSKSTLSNIKTNEQTVTNKFFTSASLGFYLHKNIGRSFNVAYGLNLLGAYVDSSSTFITSFDQVKNYATSRHFGVAPGILIQYKINRRLSVFAEYTMPIKMIVSKTGTTYSLFPDENTSDRKTTNYSMQIYNPLSVYLSCSF